MQFTLQATQTKGHRSCTVFVNKPLRQQFADYKAWLGPKTTNEQPLFASQKGGHFSANTMCQLFLVIYKQCGLTNASSHSGRRTFITRLANKGVGVRVLAELAGYRSIQTTQRYIDVSDEQMASAVELLTSALVSKPNCASQSNAQSCCKFGHLKRKERRRSAALFFRIFCFD
jgi:integrase/recombinase XerD